MRSGKTAPARLVYYRPGFPQDQETEAQAMKALVKRNAARGIWLEDVPEPKVGMNDVLIRVKRTAICGTDLHIYLWDDWAARTIPVPMVRQASIDGY